MSNNNNSSSSGLGLSSVLTIIFVVLKLVGVINWSWRWILAPTWISVILWLILVVILAIYEVQEAKKYDWIYHKRKNDKWKF